MRKRRCGKRINALMVATSVNDHLYGRFSCNMLPAYFRHRMLMISGYYQSSAIEMFYFLPNTDFTAPFIFRQRAAAFNFF